VRSTEDEGERVGTLRLRRNPGVPVRAATHFSVLTRTSNSEFRRTPHPCFLCVATAKPGRRSSDGEGTMRCDPTDADRRQPHTDAMAGAAKQARRRRPRAAIRLAGQREAANLLASFGMIGALLLFWAIAVTL
jgi:hypothetical protein